MKRENSVLIIAGPSGAGKTVIATDIVKKHPEFTFLRSGTTRAKRGDAHDNEYLYYTEEEFLRAIENGEMAEHAVYGGCMYGTPNAELERAFSQGKTPVLVLELNGAKSLALHPKYSACNVYVYADLDTIDQRLYNRYFVENKKEDSQKNYDQRRAQNLRDWLGLHDYEEYIHSLIENVASIDESVDTVLATFDAFKEGAEKDEWANHAIINGLVAVAKERADNDD